jgi:hypothetical protein
MSECVERRSHNLGVDDPVTLSTIQAIDGWQFGSKDEPVLVT